MEKNIDIVVIGAGVAGLSAALYLARNNANFLLIEKSAPGGKLNNINEIANYPFVKTISGPELAYLLFEQVSELDVKIEGDEVISVSKIDNQFVVTTAYNIYRCFSIIVSTGTVARELNIEGEKEFLNKGVSKCAVCDGSLYKNKDVAVIGNKEIAFEESLYLSNICSKVYLFANEEKDVKSSLIEKVKTNEKIVYIKNETIVVIKGSDVVNSVVSDKKTYDISAVFTYGGEKSSSTMLAPLNLKTNKAGYIDVDANQQSSLNGLFVAGDIVDKKLRQVVTAASDGAIAAISSLSYVRNIKKS